MTSIRNQRQAQARSSRAQSSTVRPYSCEQSRPGSKRSRMTTSAAPAALTPPKSNTMMHPVKQINQLSKKILDGDYDEAISSLTKTLKNIKLVLSGDAKVAMPTQPQSIQADDQMVTSDRVDDRVPKEEEEFVGSKTRGAFQYGFYHSASTKSSAFLKTSIPVGESNRLAERSVCVFKNPLIVKGDCFEVPLDAHLCEELSCVAIYNLALAHQLKAISLSSEGDCSVFRAYLSKALSLYEYSHQIFKNQAINFQVPALHCMALVSNIGQIHHLRGESPKAHQCNEYLLSVLMYTIDGGSAKAWQSIQWADHVVDEFLTIVQHLIISKDCTAPAA